VKVLYLHFFFVNIFFTHDVIADIPFLSSLLISLSKVSLSLLQNAEGESFIAAGGDLRKHMS
jgi:hypothetical protein